MTANYNRMDRENAGIREQILNEETGRTGTLPLTNGAADYVYLSRGSVLQGKYIVNGVIGQGGFGITYDGTDMKLGMHVAIKEYFPRPIATRYITSSRDVTCSYDTLSLYEHGLKNFLKEATNMAKFAGEENFIYVRDYFAENNTAYIIMEFVEGEDLKHFLKKHGRLSFNEAMMVAVPVMNALERIHEERMIHRDISPSNIMVMPDGRVKLLDFGAAREMSIETQSLTTMSAVYKYGYSPIEQQTRNMRQGAYSDIYALCATIYEMLTGIIPPSSFARLAGSESLLPPSCMGIRISGIQEKALMQGLEIYGNDRIQTVKELKSRLLGATPDRKGHRKYQRNAVLSRRQLLVVLSGCAAFLIIAAALMLLKFTGANSDQSEKESSQAYDLEQETAVAESILADQSDITDYETDDSGEPDDEIADSSGIDPEETHPEESVSSDMIAQQNAAVSIDTDSVGSLASDDESVVQEESSQVYDYPEGTMEYEGHHYYIYNDNTGSWETAAELCLSRGGYMAVINDSSENEELYQYMLNMDYDVAYFGLVRDDSLDWDYPSSGGESSSFRDWGVNSKGIQEPNDNDGPSKYAAMDIYMSDGHWDDVEYGKQVYTPEGRKYKNLFTYICEWPQ